MRFTLLAALAIATLTAAACGYADPYANSAPVANETPGPNVSPSPGTDDFNAGAGLPMVTYPDGLQYVDLTVGTGSVVRSGDILTVHYTGWLSDGTKFDSSRDRKQPLPVTIGTGHVIPGWDEGVPGMKVGGKRKLIIPPELAYGSQGQQDPASGAYIIPPNATLIFDVEVITWKAGPKPSPVPTPKPTPTPSPSPSPSAKPA